MPSSKFIKVGNHVTHLDLIAEAMQVTRQQALIMSIESYQRMLFSRNGSLWCDKRTGSPESLRETIEDLSGAQVELRQTLISIEAELVRFEANLSFMAMSSLLQQESTKETKNP